MKKQAQQIKYDYWIELNKIFSENYYPPHELKEQLSIKFSRPIQKIDNWFKQKRRKMFLKGELKNIKYKKHWANEYQFKCLMQHFMKNQHPSKKLISNLSLKLGTSMNHIRNWFSHQRIKISKQQKQDKLESIESELQEENQIKNKKNQLISDQEENKKEESINIIRIQRENQDFHQQDEVIKEEFIQPIEQIAIIKQEEENITPKLQSSEIDQIQENTIQPSLTNLEQQNYLAFLTNYQQFQMNQAFLQQQQYMKMYNQYQQQQLLCNQMRQFQKINQYQQFMKFQQFRNYQSGYFNNILN